MDYSRIDMGPPAPRNIAEQIQTWIRGNWLPAAVGLGVSVIILITLSMPFWSFSGGLEVVTWAVDEKEVTTPPSGPVDGAPPNSRAPDDGPFSSGNAGSSRPAWHLRGRVFRDDIPLEGALVWAVASDRLGNRFSPEFDRTDQSGWFEFGPIPKELRDVAGAITSEVKVNAKECGIATIDTSKNNLCTTQGIVGKPLTGKDAVTLGKTSSTRKIAIPGRAIVAIPTIFILSVIIAIVQAGSATNRKWKYYGSVLLALLFTFTMIGYIIVGLSLISASGSPGEILTLGFLNFFYDSYASDAGKAWLVSLTAESINSEAIAEATGVAIQGFGAPLWVIFMSVAGSGAFTVVMLVRQVIAGVDFTSPTQVRDRVHQIAMHQVYIFFAPLGAIIVYQLLVLGEAASREVSVAIIALASGLGINLILDKAYGTLENLIGDKRRSP